MMPTVSTGSLFGPLQWRAILSVCGLASAGLVPACTEDGKGKMSTASGNVVAGPSAARASVAVKLATAPDASGIEPTEPAAPAATRGEKLVQAKAVQDEILTAMEKVTTEFEAAGIDSAKIHAVADKQKALAAAMRAQKVRNLKELTEAENKELETYAKAKIMPLAARNIAARQKALETARLLSR